MGLRFFPSSSGDQTAKDVVKLRFIAEYANVEKQRKWFHFCCHDANLDWVNLLVWFNNTYGKDGSDDIWFATVDEVYEYMHLRNNALIRKTASENKLHITAYIPKGQYFYYPEFSLLIDGASPVSGIGTSDNVTGLSYGSHAGGLLINVRADETLTALAEELTAKYEQTGKTEDKIDALYFVAQLKSALRSAYMDRIHAVTPGALALLSVVINAGASTTTSRDVTIVPTFAGTPTHYRIGETADLSSRVWVPYSGGPIVFTLSTGYGNKTVYLQLYTIGQETTIKSSTIIYQEATVEIPVTRLSLSGETTVTQGTTTLV